MNIAFIAKRYHAVGGTEKDLYELTKQLMKRGHEVHLYCREIKTLPVDGLKIHQIPKKGFGRSGDLWSTAKTGPKMAYEGGHDIVISFARALKQDIVRCGGGLHKVFLDQMNENDGWFKRMARKCSYYHRSNCRIENRQYDPANHRLILAISKVVKKEIMENFALPESSVRIIYDGIDLNVFSPNKVRKFRESIRMQFEIPSDATLLLFVGNGFKRKGVDILLRAMNTLKDEGVYAIIVGKDPNLNIYKTVAGRHGLLKHMRFAGGQPNPSGFYGAADMLVLPSLQEAFGNVVLEAMACALPVIVSKRAGASELLQGELAQGILQDPTSPKELIEKVLQWRDLEIRNRVGLQAHAVAQGYSLDRNAEAIENLCRELVQD